jgi:PTS system nitrogen regulatory IIA component
MQLTIRQVAGLLGVPERAVYRWLDDGEIPACRIEGEVRFNRAEILEWATLRKLPLSAGILQDPANGSSLSAALEEGKVHRHVAASEPSALLQALVAALDIAPEDRQVLLGILLARGSEALTLVGDGIAIPHVRHPAVLRVQGGALALFFLERPVDLSAPDGKAVDTVFFLISPSVREHLRLLSRLAAALHDKDFRALLARKGPQEEILAGLRRIENAS